MKATFLIMCILCCTALGQSANTIADELPADLLAWANKHPVVNVGIDANFPPFDFVDDEQRVAGIGHFARIALQQSLPVTFKVTSATTFGNEYENLLAGRIDALSICANTPKRSGQVLFSKPILRFTPILVVKAGNDAFSGKVDGKYQARIGVVSGYASRNRSVSMVGQDNVVDTEDVLDRKSTRLNSSH